MYVVGCYLSMFTYLFIHNVENTHEPTPQLFLYAPALPVTLAPSSHPES